MMPVETPPQQEIQGKYGRLQLNQNGIIYFYMKDDLSVNLEIARRAVADIASLDSSGEGLLLIVMGRNFDLDFAAQRYFSMAVGVKKLAMIVQTSVQIEVANFLAKMLNLFNASYEIKPFFEIPQAEKWLLEA